MFTFMAFFLCRNSTRSEGQSPGSSYLCKYGCLWYIIHCFHLFRNHFWDVLSIPGFASPYRFYFYYYCQCHFDFFCLLSEEEQVAKESSGKHQGAVGESSVQINCSDGGRLTELEKPSSVQNNCSAGGRLTELEKLLNQKTFTRYIFI